MSTSVVVVWMERAIDGTAASAHLRGTLARLSLIDARVEKTIADTTSPDGKEGYPRKGARIILLTFRGMLAARRRRVLIARFHPLLLPLLIVWRIVGGGIILSVQGALDSAGDNQYSWLRGSRTYRRLATASSKLAHGLIAGAPIIEDHIRREMLGSGATLVPIANGVFVDELDRAADSIAPLTEPYALFLGNLAKWQGVDTLVKAVQDPAWPRGLQLVVIGDGVDRTLVENVANIRWLGRLPSREANRWLGHALCSFSIQRSDVTVAKYGYWPFKLIESAAAGVPIVCSDALGLPAAAEVLGHAIVVPAHDSMATAKAVHKLWMDGDLRNALAMAGRNHVRAFDWSAGAPALERLIKEVSAHRER